MAARWPSGSGIGAHARHCVGVRPLLCSHHGCELEVPGYHTHRFLNRDYIMFDCGGTAFSVGRFPCATTGRLNLDSTDASACEPVSANRHLRTPVTSRRAKFLLAMRVVL